jgi:hypothetical protein
MLRRTFFIVGLLSTMAHALPNPAYVYCTEKGGVIETRADKEGNEFGICMFDQEGVYSECNQWEYVRGECEPGQCFYWSVDSRKCEILL